MKFIDMHCHIIPYVDDGATDMEEAVKMLREAYKEGIMYFVATPHYHPIRGTASKDMLNEQLVQLRKEAKSIDEKIKIFIGHEIYFGQDVPKLIENKEIFSINRRGYVLVEFSPTAEAGYIRQGVQQIQAKGYKVVLAHVERYKCVQKDRDLLYDLHRMGIHFQINASSITGKAGMKTRKFVRGLMEEDMVFCVGTDAHNMKTRPPHMRKAAEYVEKKYGKEYARRIFFSNAAMMLKNQE